MNTIGEINYVNPGYGRQDSRQTSSNIMGKNDFLNLLVTQLRYQDPMQPMQDQEIVAQLAQFSQLEQLENMSGSLDTATQVNYLMSQTIANTMATTLIGKTVIAEGADFELTTGEDADLSYNLGTDAAVVTIKVKNDTGAVVRTVEIHDQNAGNNTYVWDGRDDNGTRVAPGKYSYEISASTANGEQVTSSKRVIGAVDSVQYIDGRAYLAIGGYKVDLSTIIEIVNGNSSQRNNG